MRGSLAEAQAWNPTSCCRLTWRMLTSPGRNASASFWSLVRGFLAPCVNPPQPRCGFGTSPLLESPSLLSATILTLSAPLLGPRPAGPPCARRSPKFVAAELDALAASCQRVLLARFTTVYDVRASWLLLLFCSLCSFVAREFWRNHGWLANIIVFSCVVVRRYVFGSASRRSKLDGDWKRAAPSGALASPFAQPKSNSQSIGPKLRPNCIVPSRTLRRKGSCVIPYRSNSVGSKRFRPFQSALLRERGRERESTLAA